MLRIAVNPVPAVLRTLLLILLVILFTGSHAEAQHDNMEDSLKRKLPLAKTDAEKVYALSDLADYYFGTVGDQSRKYEAEAMRVAQLNRDRKLIIFVYLRNGRRYTFFGNNISGNLAPAADNFQHAEKLARENGLDEELAYSYIGQAGVARLGGRFDKAFNYNNLALSIAGGKDDSLRIEVYDAIGNTYLARNEKLLAFRNYLEALNIAELSKKDDLLRITYNQMGDFYSNLELYDKAIDYSLKVTAIDQKNGKKYQLLEDYNKTARLFSAEKQESISLPLYEHAIALADSLQYHRYKLFSYVNIADMYFANDQVAEGLAYLNKHPDALQFIKDAGQGFIIDGAYGGIYTVLGKPDSAYHYFKKAEPEMEQKGSLFRRFEFYCEFGDYYKSRHDLKQAIAYYLKARDIGKEVKSLQLLKNSAQNLDTLYNRIGNINTAYYYNTEYNLYKDSLATLGQEADVLRLEVENDNKRRERLAKEEEERTQHRHNVQYMGFTVGLIGLFVLLAMLGLFVVSTRTIRTMGFFSFIFLFEFVILLADKQIHEWTHGEPWKILIIKIFLAAILLPLHHWLEHRVIHYLTSRRKIAVPGTPVLGQLFRKKES